MPDKNIDIPDEILVTSALQGDRQSLEKLIERHSSLVYTLCYKMARDKNDAADLSQEIFIKVITKLDSFERNSAFKTWLYRIAVNHLLNHRQSAAVRQRTHFAQFGSILDDAPDLDLAAGGYYEADQPLLVEETKQTCMSGMLLCLDSRHRLVFILGELLGINDKIGGEVLNITPENYRMILSRAKRDLYQFMHDKCGLINKENPCRCAKKTMAFIKAGFVDPKHLQFAGKHRATIESLAGEKQEALEDFLDSDYRQLYRGHSVLENKELVQSLKALLKNKKITDIFNTNLNNES